MYVSTLFPNAHCAFDSDLGGVGQTPEEVTQAIEGRAWAGYLDTFTLRGELAVGCISWRQ